MQPSAFSNGAPGKRITKIGSLLFSYDGYNEFSCATMITILTEIDALSWIHDLRMRVLLAASMGEGVVKICKLDRMWCDSSRKTLKNMVKMFKTA